MAKHSPGHIWLLFALGVLHCGLLILSAFGHSPSVDEAAHLPSGIRHWSHEEFELYAVNPPLVRATAALPLLAVGPETDWRRLRPDPSLRSEFQLAEDFAASNGRSTFRYFAIARCACIPFSVLGVWVCWRWASELYGDQAGLMAAGLWCFSPNILANAAMIVPDVGASALGVLAAYLFWRWLRQPMWGRGIFAGIGLGLAELTKFTWMILFPLWLLLWVVYRSRTASGIGWKKEAGQLGVVFFVAVYLINAGYGFEGSFTKLKEFGFVSKTLAGAQEGRVERKGNRFKKTFLGELPVPVPRNYLLGIDVQKRDFERGIRSYLRGEWQPRGWWYYYIYAMLVKVPIGTWILILLAVYVTVRCSDRAGLCESGPGPEAPAPTRDSLEITWRDELALLAPAVVVLVLVSSQTGFNHHLRYVLPAFPFGFIFIGKVAACLRWPWKAAVTDASGRPARSPAAPDIRSPGKLFSIVAAGALLWSVGSSLRIYPHSISYFNELAGGPMNGHRHLLNSNIDWGQDLLHLKDWYDEHPNARPFHLAYFGGVDPHTAGFDYKLPPNAPEPGWYAVSVNLMRGSRRAVWAGNGKKQWADEKRFTYFGELKPTAHAGYSIYIYHITYDDAQRVRKELGLSPLPPRM